MISLLKNNVLDEFKNKNVLIIGDIMLDRFVYGKVERISPEAPVPIFKFDYDNYMLGGAGNVARNIVSLGGNAYFVGIIGKDEAGKKLSKLLNEAKIKNHLLRIDNYFTIIKTRLIAGHNHLLRGDKEEKLPIFIDLLPRFKKILIKLIKKIDIVILSDYNKGILTNITTQMIIKICNKYDKKVLIDPKGNDYSKYNGAFLVKPNLKEFSLITNKKYDLRNNDCYDNIRKDAKCILDKYKIKNIIITLSEYGMVYISSQNPDEIINIPTNTDEIFDVSGAGDTAIATIGLSIVSNISFKESIILANIASGIVIKKLGTAVATLQELKNSIEEINIKNDIEIKNILTIEKLKNVVLELRKQHKIIGFTNGCFDCCHLGHLYSFIEAKKYCDILIVAVNSDSSIKRYKGENRPIQNQNTRTFLVSSLKFVDYVIIFDEDTPINIVNTIRPDIIAKEGYNLENWPERKLVESYGGKAIVLKHIKGYSTTNIVKKILKENKN